MKEQLLSHYLYRNRDRFHPLNHLRRNALSRTILSAIDVPIWVSLPRIRWKVKLRLVRHASFIFLPDGGEPGISALVAAIVLQCGIRSFWDVGANIGYYSWLVKSIERAAQIRMFEPDPDNLALVRETIRRSALLDITLREVIVSDMCGVRCFARDSISGSTGGVLGKDVSYSEREWGLPPKFVRVTAVSLDDEWANAGAVDLIKIDVEGHEEAVIRGAFDTICCDQPILIFECFHGGREIINVLQPLGYLFIDADRRTSDLQIASNFLALPKRHHAILGKIGPRWRREMARATGNS
jgi:FkbM family methyltransferase